MWGQQDKKQIQTIQEAIKAGSDMKIDLVGKALAVNAEMTIFIAMNPGYSGRSNMPDNLKQLFRSLAILVPMTQPDRKLIADMMLFSQGFQTAEVLAQKEDRPSLHEQLSSQCHYDFGLRALKYVLVSAGNIKREEIQRMVVGETSIDYGIGVGASMRKASEQQVLIQSVCETLVPKLVSEDIALLFLLLQDVFPDAKYMPNKMERLRKVLAAVSDKLLLCHSTNPDEKGYQWKSA